MRRTLVVTVLLVVSIGFCLYLTAGSAGRPESYVSGFRAAFAQVRRASSQYGAGCLRATRVRQLPACGRGAAVYQGSLPRLLRFVTDNRPPRTSLPETSADLRRLGTSIRVLQQRLTKLAALIKAKDLARVKAMVGSDAPLLAGYPIWKPSPINTPMEAFMRAAKDLEVDIPGLRLGL